MSAVRNRPRPPVQRPPTDHGWGLWLPLLTITRCGQARRGPLRLRRRLLRVSLLPQGARLPSAPPSALSRSGVRVLLPSGRLSPPRPTTSSYGDREDEKPVTIKLTRGQAFALSDWLHEVIMMSDKPTRSSRTALDGRGSTRSPALWRRRRLRSSCLPTSVVWIRRGYVISTPWAAPRRKRRVRACQLLRLEMASAADTRAFAPSGRHEPRPLRGCAGRRRTRSGPGRPAASCRALGLRTYVWSRHINQGRDA